MGFFSWMFADTGNTEALKVGKPAYLVWPDGSVTYIHRYDGYGRFDSYEIHKLVVDWNKDFLSVDNLIKPERNEYDEQKYFDSAMRRYEYGCNRLNDFISGMSDEEMHARYGRDWKLEIGIDISDEDEQNASLKYPIRICKEEPKDISALPASKSDPLQGCY